MTCFLVYLTYNSDTNGSFLPNVLSLPHKAMELDEFFSLSYASSWLQANLTQIRESYLSWSEEEGLQSHLWHWKQTFRSRAKRQRLCRGNIQEREL